MKLLSALVLTLLFNLSYAEDCAHCGNKMTGANEGTLVLKYMSGSELIENLACTPGADLSESFCTLLTVFDNIDDYHTFIKRCFPNTSLDEIYGRAFFACSDVGYHQDEISLLSHLAIQFPGFSVGIMPVVRGYRDQGRLERFSELLNQKDSQGRTFLDVYKEALDRGEYIGTQLPAATASIIKKACMLGGVYNKYPQPADCKRKDKLFK